KSEPPPPPPPPPPSPEASVTELLRYTEGYYRAELDEDAKSYHVKPVSLEALAQPLAYHHDLTTPRTLDGKHGALDTPHLRLTTRVLKEWAMTPSGQGFRAEHAVLSITNKTDHYLAYHVETSVAHPERCTSQGSVAHNAIALKPGET